MIKIQEHKYTKNSLNMGHAVRHVSLGRKNSPIKNLHPVKDASLRDAG